MGGATIQGQLWGACAQDWATYVEQVCSPLLGATLGRPRSHFPMHEVSDEMSIEKFVA